MNDQKSYNSDLTASFNDSNRKDKIKTMSGWESELAIDISVEKTDILGVYTVQSGDTLSKIAKQLLGSSNKYTAIFNANTDVLKNPDLLKVGQKLKIPNP